MNNTQKEKGIGLNKYQLLQTQTEDVIQAYQDILEKMHGSLTTVADNDAISKIYVAIVALKPNTEQISILNKFTEAFKAVENLIDPERLNFNITKAADEEICLNRYTVNGLTKLIINDDGTIALSFIGYKGCNKPDILEFYDADNVDYEHLTFCFLSF